MNLKKRIESAVYKAQLLRRRALRESQKEDWKLSSSVVSATLPARPNRNLKKRIERVYTAFVKAVYEVVGKTRAESQKEDWKAEVHDVVIYFSRYFLNLKKRIERLVEGSPQVVEEPNLKKRIES